MKLLAATESEALARAERVMRLYAPTVIETRPVSGSARRTVRLVRRGVPAMVVRHTDSEGAVTSVEVQCLDYESELIRDAAAQSPRLTAQERADLTAALATAEDREPLRAQPERVRA